MPEARVVWITGGACSSGRTTAWVLARLGDRVVIADVDDPAGQDIIDRPASRAGPTRCSKRATRTSSASSL
ncbi:MAG: hypothetical protein JXB85_16945 [Anaerolineales bacterium]|nr:hypothetical protein [Anaerolineales bacterium]